MIVETDLHGVKHEDVRRVVIRKIEDNWGSNCDWVFITGHSARMKELVSEVVNEYDMSVKEGVYPSYLVAEYK